MHDQHHEVWAFYTENTISNSFFPIRDGFVRFTTKNISFETSPITHKSMTL